MQVKLSKEELYPVFVILEPSEIYYKYGESVEITAEQYDKIIKAQEMFDETQDILRGAIRTEKEKQRKKEMQERSIRKACQHANVIPSDSPLEWECVDCGARILGIVQI